MYIYMCRYCFIYNHLYIYTSKHLYIHLYLYLSPISKRAISPQIACLAILAAHQVSANVVVKTAELVLAVRGRWWMTKRYPKSILKPDNYGWVKWDYEVPNIWKKNKIHVPNHQPVMVGNHHPTTFSVSFWVLLCIDAYTFKIEMIISLAVQNRKTT